MARSGVVWLGWVRLAQSLFLPSLNRAGAPSDEGARGWSIRMTTDNSPRLCRPLLPDPKPCPNGPLRFPALPLGSCTSYVSSTPQQTEQGAVFPPGSSTRSRLFFFFPVTAKTCPFFLPPDSSRVAAPGSFSFLLRMQASLFFQEQTFPAWKKTKGVCRKSAPPPPLF